MTPQDNLTIMDAPETILRSLFGGRVATNKKSEDMMDDAVKLI